MKLFFLCGYHGCCCSYLDNLSILYQTQVQSYQNFVVAHTLTGNGQGNGAVVNYIIFLSIIVDSNLRTILLVWVALSYCRITVTIIGSGGGIGHVLNTSLIVVGWMIFLVVARMDIALGNLKTYQRMLGIVSINIYCNFTDYYLHLPSLNMLKMLLT